MKEEKTIEGKKLKEIIDVSKYISIIVITIVSLVYYLLKHYHLTFLLKSKNVISIALFLVTILIIFILLRKPKSLYYIVPSELMLFFSTSLIIIMEDVLSSVLSYNHSNNYPPFRFYILFWIIFLLLTHKFSNSKIPKLKGLTLRSYRLFSISIIFISSFFLLFTAIAFIFYSKVIAALVGSLLLFLSHSFFKNILPSMYEIHDLTNTPEDSLLHEYEPSILSNITLTLIDSFSALIIFSYGVAQLFSKQYTAVLYLKTKSKEFNAIKDLVKEENIYIDHIEVPQKNFMLSSNENLFLLIFILTLYGSGFILWKLLQYLYRDIYNKEDKSIMSFTNKLVKAKEDQSQTFSPKNDNSDCH